MSKVCTKCGQGSEFTIDKDDKMPVCDTCITKMLESGEAYKCDACGGVFLRGWSDEEAQAEAMENFGTFDAKNMDVICDDCYHVMLNRGSGEAECAQ
jgi:hypothetical protein